MRDQRSWQPNPSTEGWRFCQRQHNNLGERAMPQRQCGTSQLHQVCSPARSITILRRRMTWYGAVRRRGRMRSELTDAGGALITNMDSDRTSSARKRRTRASIRTNALRTLRRLAKPWFKQGVVVDKAAGIKRHYRRRRHSGATEARDSLARIGCARPPSRSIRLVVVQGKHYRIANAIGALALKCSSHSQKACKIIFVACSEIVQRQPIR